NNENPQPGTKSGQSKRKAGQSMHHAVIYDACLKEELEQKKKILESRTSILSEKEKELKEKLTDTKEEEKELKEKRKLLVAKIEKPLYNLYLRVYGSKGKLAVVPANEGFCGGCYTVLPSQKLSELRRADSIVQCDACSRILYYEIEDVH
ncbi:MAG: C4-type zinc ribbon domain-containing protein, partial [Candidatus Delongbacteria bacterium]